MRWLVAIAVLVMVSGDADARRRYHHRNDGRDAKIERLEETIRLMRATHELAAEPVNPWDLETIDYTVIGESMFDKYLEMLREVGSDRHRWQMWETSNQPATPVEIHKQPRARSDVFGLIGALFIVAAGISMFYRRRSAL